MRVFDVVYIHHLEEKDAPEVSREYMGWLLAEENKAYRKHCDQNEEMGVAFLNHLLKKVADDNYDLSDDDIYYYLTQGSDKAYDSFGVESTDSIHTPEVGNYYLGLVYDDDMAIIVGEVGEC